MRCASCGTENAQDSRFCGGCGARIGASGPRVAPTQKISDDAPFPQRPAAPAPIAHNPAQPSAPRPIPQTPYVSTPPPITTQPGVVPPQRPLSAPPAVYAPVATPAPSSPPSAPPHAPNGAPRAAKGRPPTPRFDEPAASMPTVARRPWALIIAVLVIDMALAGAGAWMLSEGLGDRPSEKPATPPPGAARASTAAPATSPSAAPAAPATGRAPAASAPTRTGSNARDPQPPSPK
jgi:hypothetical protein